MFNIHKKSDHDVSPNKTIPGKNLTEEKHPCTQCKNVYNSMTYLTMHIKATHDQMRSYERNMGYKCDVCNFETSSVKILNIHKRSEHINEIKSKMKCDMCEFGASSRIDLERHNKSYHKCANCEFKTEKQTDLLKHKKNAHKIKCSTCSFEAGG